MKLKCQCCEIEREFKDDEEAFQEGWDAPPHFTRYIVCDLCPAVGVVLGKSHKMAHALWAKNGRPSKFTVKECGTDDEIGDASLDAEFEAINEKLISGEIDAEEVLGELLKLKEARSKGVKNGTDRVS